MSESMFVNIEKLVESEKAFIKAEKHQGIIVFVFYKESLNDYHTLNAQNKI